jgi:NADH:ubiquinone oxidoreductase subunit E
MPTVPAEVSTSGQVEVCMGGKCKKGGAQQILASLQGSIPESSNISVTSCKCMGKCKGAANVRVTKDDGASQLHSHVVPDDVDTLLEFHFGLGASVGSQSGDVRLPVYARIDSGLAIA